MFDFLQAQQHLADCLKAFVNTEAETNHQPYRTVPRRRQALQAINRFEGLDWYPELFEMMLPNKAPGLTFDGQWHYTGDGDPLEVVTALLNEYTTIVKRKSPALLEAERTGRFTIEAAAEYLDKKVPTIKKHLYQTGELVGSVEGHTVFFTQDELDAFKAKDLKRGWPKGKKRQPEVEPR